MPDQETATDDFDGILRSMERFFRETCGQGIADYSKKTGSRADTNGGRPDLIIAELMKIRINMLAGHSD